jgi:hypothetical protein
VKISNERNVPAALTSVEEPPQFSLDRMLDGYHKRSEHHAEEKIWVARRKLKSDFAIFKTAVVPNLY